MLNPDTQLYRYSRLLARELILPYDRLSFSRHPVSAQRAGNFVLSKIEGRLRRGRPRSYPIGLQLEPTVYCQLDCPYCPRIKATQDMSLGHMEWQHYELLLEEIGPYVAAIAFWQWGEPLLHPGIADMVKLANSYGIITFMSTNAQLEAAATDLRGLVESGLDMLIISMDGATQKTYEAFRAGGELEKLKQFTTGIVNARGRSNTPLINLRVVATKENEPEIETIRDFAAEANVDMFSVKSVSLYYDDNPDNLHLPVDKKYRSYQYVGNAEKINYQQIPNLCRKPWAWPTLRYDGTLLFCECDHQMIAPLGNVFDSGSFKKVWRGSAAQNMRSRFQANGVIDLEYCARCRYKLDDAIRRIEQFNTRGGTVHECL